MKKCPWYINTISVVLAGLALMLANQFISIDTSPYTIYPSRASIVIDSIIKGIAVAAAVWLAYSLPRFIYRSERRIKEEKNDQ